MLGLNVVAGGPSGVGEAGAGVVGLVRDAVGGLVGLNLPRLGALVVVTALGPSVVTATVGRRFRVLVPEGADVDAGTLLMAGAAESLSSASTEVNGLRPLDFKGVRRFPKPPKEFTLFKFKDVKSRGGSSRTSDTDNGRRRVTTRTRPRRPLRTSVDTFCTSGSSTSMRSDIPSKDSLATAFSCREVSAPRSFSIGIELLEASTRTPTTLRCALGVGCERPLPCRPLLREGSLGVLRGGCGGRGVLGLPPGLSSLATASPSSFLAKIPSVERSFKSFTASKTASLGRSCSPDTEELSRRIATQVITATCG